MCAWSLKVECNLGSPHWLLALCLRSCCAIQMTTGCTHLKMVFAICRGSVCILFAGGLPAEAPAVMCTVSLAVTTL